VAGERFDLVVSNPPFVVSPDLGLLYRHSGLRGDGVSELLVRGAPAHLTDGGLAHMLVMWAHEPGGDWSAPLRGWVEGSGCDAIFLRYGTDDPLTYAARFNAEAPEDELGATLDRWLAYYRELGIEAIASGAVIMRRREGENWVVAEDAPRRSAPAGHHVERMIEAQDFLARVPELAGERLVPAPDHVVTQSLRLDGGGFDVESTAIRLRDGLGFEASIDSAVGHLLSRLDGMRTVREAAADLSVDADALGTRVIPLVARMVRVGFLVPAPG
jgi:hypothetical protein